MSPAADITPQTLSTRIITGKLERFLTRDRVRRVYFAEDSAPPPVLAYVTHFPRLYIPLAGSHIVELAQNGAPTTIRAVRGQAVFVPENAWDKPTWSDATEVLTFLFGTKHIGISLAQHKGSSEAPLNAIKTHIHGAYDAIAHSVITALTAFAADRSQGPLDRLLVEALLHSCLRLFRATASHRPRKAIRTYESICLYMQENFQRALTRESVAEHFGLAPNHVSRLFRHEGQVRFNDYLNSIRMNRAKFMLRNYSLTLKEVAANCGYNDIAYFCRMFKKMNNETPTQYRALDSSSSTLAGGLAEHF
jgi:AraC-like DNA-binding protein